MTTQTLIDRQPTGSRTDTNDRSAYWSPAVYQDGKLVKADGFVAYYKGRGGVEQGIPLGLRMVAGDAHATRNQGGQNGGYAVSGPDGATNNTFSTRSNNTMLRRPNGETIIMRTELLGRRAPRRSRPQSSHGLIDASRHPLPQTHPVEIPQIVTFTRYDVDGGAGFELASGEWFTYHQDFRSGWEPNHMADMVDICIDDPVNCRVSGPAIWAAVTRKMCRS